MGDPFASGVVLIGVSVPIDVSTVKSRSLVTVDVPVSIASSRRWRGPPTVVSRPSMVTPSDPSALNSIMVCLRTEQWRERSVGSHTDRAPWQFRGKRRRRLFVATGITSRRQKESTTRVDTAASENDRTRPAPPKRHRPGSLLMSQVVVISSDRSDRRPSPWRMPRRSPWRTSRRRHRQRRRRRLHAGSSSSRTRGRCVNPST